MKKTKKIFLIGELYKPLIPWLLEDKAPQGVPAVYNLYQYLGNSDKYQFYSIVYNPTISKKKVFPNGSVIELRKFSFPIYYVWKLLVFCKLLIVGNRILKKDSFDLVYGLSTFSIVAAILGKKRRISSVGRIYGTILTKEVAQRNYFRLYTRFLFDIWAIKYPADTVICTQDGTQYDKVSKFFKKDAKVYLFYNGMDVSLRNKLLSFTPTARLEEPLRFCYIARLEYYKRQDLALQIIHQLVHQYDLDVQLTMLGSGSKKTYLQALATELNITANLQFIEEMAHQNIPEFLNTQQAAMFFYEGGSLGNILWESALAGKLIITVDNAGTGELFKDGQNCLIAPEGIDFIEKMSEKIAGYVDQDISFITKTSRALVSRLITSWEERFDREFELLFSDK